MTKEKNILKEKLINIEKENYLLENDENYFPLALEMMDSIGALDPKLRDDLIYGTLLKWVTKNRFSQEQLETLLNISLEDSHLFYKIVDKEPDAVFKRTFSVLMVALIIYQLRTENLLSEKVSYEVKGKLIEYMIKEQDLRGYVEIKGWAHSAAHTADALDELVQCLCFNKSDLLDILNVIKTKICIGHYVYIDEESERMVNVVENAFNRKILSSSEIKEWLQGFTIENAQGSYVEKYHLKVNIKGFLRSLYFRLLEHQDSNYIIEEIKKILKSLK